MNYNCGFFVFICRQSNQEGTFPPAPPNLRLLVPEVEPLATATAATAAAKRVEATAKRVMAAALPLTFLLSVQRVLTCGNRYSEA